MRGIAKVLSVLIPLTVPCIMYAAILDAAAHWSVPVMIAVTVLHK